ncbi:MAG: VCBS repeat-containing protein [Planctomycetota bacterium]
MHVPLAPFLVLLPAPQPRIQAPALPRYDRHLQLEETAATAANIAFGDLDGDGDLDIVLARGRHWPLPNRVLFGDGEGGIEETRALGTDEDRTYTGALADLDGDGSLDVLISNEADPQRVYLNDGEGRFTLGSTFGEGWSTRNSSVVDVDGDGHLDVLVANRGRGSTNYLCLNDGKGGFPADRHVPIAPVSTTTITAADFDGDERMDLLVPCRDGGQSHVHMAAEGPTFPEEAKIPFGPANASIRIAQARDLDDDGALDIVAVDDRRGTASIYFGREDLTFAPAMVLQRGEGSPVEAGASLKARRPYSLAIADLNRDGRPDVVIGNWNGRPHAYVQGADRGFSAVPFGDDDGGTYGIAVADFDGDGVMDIGLARSDAPSIVYFGAL